MIKNQFIIDILGDKISKRQCKAEKQEMNLALRRKNKETKKTVVGKIYEN